jgi:hypothetical protein
VLIWLPMLCQSRWNWLYLTWCNTGSYKSIDWKRNTWSFVCNDAREFKGMSIYAYAVSLEIIVMSLVVSVYMFLFSKLTFKELHQFFYHHGYVILESCYFVNCYLQAYSMLSVWMQSNNRTTFIWYQSKKKSLCTKKFMHVELFIFIYVMFKGWSTFNFLICSSVFLGDVIFCILNYVERYIIGLCQLNRF